MLAKKNRLKAQKDFDRIFRDGKGLKESFLVFRTVKSGQKESRFGFIVGKVVSKKTIVRNKLKRRLRDIVKNKIKEIRGGIDAVFIARPGLEKKEFSELEKIVNKIFKRTKILKKDQS